jgi:hypothetical protein
LEDKLVSQVIAFAGSGKLQDGGVTSKEFREFLAQIPSPFLSRYADECLTTKFDGNGFALQDVINEVGNRLGFEVTAGRYRGLSGHIVLMPAYVVQQYPTFNVQKLTESLPNSIHARTLFECITVWSYRQAMLGLSAEPLKLIDLLTALSTAVSPIKFGSHAS